MRTGLAEAASGAASPAAMKERRIMGHGPFALIVPTRATSHKLAALTQPRPAVHDGGPLRG